MKQIGNLAFGFMAIVFFSIVLSSCNKNRIHERNLAEIEGYIAGLNLASNPDFITTESGLTYAVTTVGDGNFPTINDEVKVNYTGYLTSQTIFDQAQNAEFPLTGVIEGWQEGIPKFSRGGSGYLFIPARLGYGSRTSGQIPGNSVLIFEIDLIDF